MSENKSNSLAATIQILAYIEFLCALIVGIVLGRDLRGDFSFGAALIYWIAGFVAGIMLLGFAEIINLLQEISNNTSGQKASLTLTNDGNNTASKEIHRSKKTVENVEGGNTIVCPNCGRGQSKDRSICYNCGAKLNDAENS